MKLAPTINKKGAPTISKIYYDKFVCHNCQEETKATVLWESFVSDNCILMRVRCDKCSHERVPLVDRESYKKHVLGGNYFNKNTP
jgi:hypothetical protein